MKLTLTSLLYISCLKKYSAKLLIKSLHLYPFLYNPEWKFTPWILHHFSKTWAYWWICQHFMNYFFGRVEFLVEIASSYLFFTVRLCPSVATWSNKVEDLKFALLSIKVMFVQGISFSFSSCDLQIVKIIFLSPPESVTESQGNFFSHLLIVRFFETIKFYSFEKTLDSTSFNLQRKVKESLQQSF